MLFPILAVIVTVKKVAAYLNTVSPFFQADFRQEKGFVVRLIEIFYLTVLYVL